MFGTALRIAQDLIGIDVPTLIASPSEFGRVDLSQAGFIRLPIDSEDRVLIPRLEKLSLDVKDRFNVDIWSTPTAFRQPEMLGGFAFSDRHPDEWWDAVHRRGSVAVIVGEPDLFSHAPTVVVGLKSLADSGAFMAVMPLVVRAYDSGVGTAAPGE